MCIHAELRAVLTRVVQVISAENQRSAFYVHKRPHVHDFLETVRCACVLGILASDALVAVRSQNGTMWSYSRLLYASMPTL